MYYLAVIIIHKLYTIDVSIDRMNALLVVVVVVVAALLVETMLDRFFNILSSVLEVLNI